MNLTGVTKKVHDILRDKPKTRNDDGLLIAHYVYRYHNRFVRKDVDGNPCVCLKNLKDLRAFETITRARRIVQNDHGLFPSDEMIREARLEKEMNYRDCEVREVQQMSLV